MWTFNTTTTTTTTTNNNNNDNNDFFFFWYSISKWNFLNFFQREFVIYLVNIQFSKVQITTLEDGEISNIMIIKHLGSPHCLIIGAIFEVEELKQMDQRTRKLIPMHSSSHARYDVDRLYEPRKEGGRALKIVSMHEYKMLWKTNYSDQKQCRQHKHQ